MSDPSVIGIGKVTLFDISCDQFFIKNINLNILLQEVLDHYSPSKRVSNDKKFCGLCYEDTVFEGKEEAKKLIDCVNAIANSIGLQLSGGMWAQIHQPFESTNVHHHIGNESEKAFVFYVKVPDKAGALYFEVDPFGTSVIQPIESMLVVFPACIKHGVYKNLSNELRISIAGNLKKL